MLRSAPPSQESLTPESQVPRRYFLDQSSRALAASLLTLAGCHSMRDDPEIQRSKNLQEAERYAHERADEIFSSHGIEYLIKGYIANWPWISRHTWPQDRLGIASEISSQRDALLEETLTVLRSRGGVGDRGEISADGIHAEVTVEMYNQLQLALLSLSRRSDSTLATKRLLREGL